MATSGTVTWRPQIEEIVVEAFERVGVNEGRITQALARSARRSLNFMFADWSVQGINYWKTTETTLTLVESQRVYTLPAGTVDVLTASVRRSSSDIPLTRLSLTDYQAITNKTSEGMPTQFYFDRQYTPQLYLWNVPENSTDTVIYWQLSQLEDVTAANEDSDVPYRWTEAMTAGLADRLSEKVSGVSPDKILRLAAKAQSTFNNAAAEEGEKAALQIIPG